MSGLNDLTIHCACCDSYEFLMETNHCDGCGLLLCDDCNKKECIVHNKDHEKDRKHMASLDFFGDQGYF